MPCWIIFRNAFLIGKIRTNRKKMNKPEENKYEIIKTNKTKNEIRKN
jgi:hypothetical protein